MPSLCNLCGKDVSKKIHATACLVCEQDHVVTVHQRCFDKAIEKAIRVRSTRSTAFENIARSTLHSWKTQKCAFPDCVKWLTEYTQHEPEDPMAAQAPTPLLEKVQIKTHKPREEEEEGEEEDSDQCTALKVDGSRCNFKKSDEELGLCRRCAEKHMKQAAVTMALRGSSERDDEGNNDGTPAKKDRNQERKEKKSKAAKSVGLNSMLKSLAKPAAPAPTEKEKAASLSPPSSNNAITSPLKRATSSPAAPEVAVAWAPSGRGGASNTAVTSPAPLASNGNSEIRNEAQLVSAVKSFIESSSLEGKTTPRELVRYLGNLPGSGDHSTALDVMRAKFVKLRSFLEAHPKVFAVHDSTGNSSTSSSSLLGDDKAEQYGIALASSSVISAVDILAMMMPQIQTELPSRVETVLETLNLARYSALFVEQEFLPQDLFLATDDDFKDLGLPAGARVKLRNWIRAQIAPSA